MLSGVLGGTSSDGSFGAAPQSPAAAAGVRQPGSLQAAAALRGSSSGSEAGGERMGSGSIGPDPNSNPNTTLRGSSSGSEAGSECMRSEALACAAALLSQRGSSGSGSIAPDPNPNPGLTLRDTPQGASQAGADAGGPAVGQLWEVASSPGSMPEQADSDGSAGGPDVRQLWDGRGSSGSGSRVISLTGRPGSPDLGSDPALRSRPGPGDRRALAPATELPITTPPPTPASAGPAAVNMPSTHALSAEPVAAPPLRAPRPMSAPHSRPSPPAPRAARRSRSPAPEAAAAAEGARGPRRGRSNPTPEGFATLAAAAESARSMLAAALDRLERSSQLRGRRAMPKGIQSPGEGCEALELTPSASPPGSTGTGGSAGSHGAELMAAAPTLHLATSPAALQGTPDGAFASLAAQEALEGRHGSGSVGAVPLARARELAHTLSFDVNPGASTLPPQLWREADREEREADAPPHPHTMEDPGSSQNPTYPIGIKALARSCGRQRHATSCGCAEPRASASKAPADAASARRTACLHAGHERSQHTFACGVQPAAAACGRPRARPYFGA